MANSGIVTLPMLRGPLAGAGPWQALLARPNKRIYPFPLGGEADVATTGTTIQLGGLGEPFAINDYIIVCEKTAYGNVNLFIPNFSKIRKVTSVSGSEDNLLVDAAVTVADGDYVLNIGVDGASAPASDPDLDGIVAITDDPYGVDSNSNGYLLTGDGGQFRGYLPAGTQKVDILVTDNSKNPEIVIPGVDVSRDDPRQIIIRESPSDASAPPTDHVVIYARVTGGKTELVARFPTGTIQQIAIED